MTAVEPAARPIAPDSPFPGLTYYTEEYADLFFGRDVERGRIIGNVRVSRLTLLYAQSGVGKSSLLSAGVAPLLRKLAEEQLSEDGAADYIPVVFRTWAGDPVPALITEIERAITPFFKYGETSIELPRDDLMKACELAAASTGSTLLLILDQFEEYFNYHPSSGESPFPDQLATCLNRPDLRVNVLLAIRDDAYARIGDLLKGKIPSVYGNYLALEHLSAPALRDSITKAVSEFNRLYAADNPVTVEPGLVEKVLEQVSAATGAQTGSANGSSGPTTDAAFVQLVMKRLWDEEQAAGSRVLHNATLDRLGGAAAIIGTHLDASMARLGDEQQNVAAAAFRFLVTPERAKIALGTKALSDWTGVSENDLEEVLGRLAMPDLRILRPVVLGDRRRYEIFHDGLAEPILSWRGRHEQAELEEERALKEKAEAAAAAAEQREQHERRRRRIYARTAAVSLAAFLGTAIVLAVYWRNQGAKERDRNYSTEIAERVAFQSGNPNFGSGAAALANIEANRLSPTIQARNGVLSYLQANVALPKIAIGHTRTISGVIFLPGEKYLATSSYDGTARIWDLNGNEIGTPLLAHGTDTAGLPSLAAAGGLLAVGRSDGEVDMWNIADVRKPRYLRTISLGSDAGSVSSVAFSPDGKFFLAGDNKGTVAGWNISDLISKKTYVPAAFTRTTFASGVINALSFCPNSSPKVERGVVIVGASTGATAWKVQPQYKDLGPTVNLDKRAILSAACAPSGAYALGINNSGNPGILYAPWKGNEKFFMTSDRIEAMGFAKGGKELVTAGDDWNVIRWDVETGQTYGPPLTSAVYGVIDGLAVSADGNTIAAGGSNDYVKIWSMGGNVGLAELLGSLPQTSCCGDNTRTRAESPDILTIGIGAGGKVATATPLHAYIWSAGRPAVNSSPKPLATLPDGYATPVAYSGDLLAVAHNAQISLWNTAAPCNKAATVLPKKCLLDETTQNSDEYSYAFAFDRTGKVLASGGQGGSLWLWDVSDPHHMKLLYTFPKERDSINQVAFSPRDDVLGVAGNDGTLTLWDTTDPKHPKLIARREGAHEGLPVVSITFSPTVPLLASGGQDQQVRLWTYDVKAATPDERLVQAGQFGQTNTIFSVGFTPDGKILAAGDADGSACLYDVAVVEPIGNGACLLGHASENQDYYAAIEALQFSPDGQHLLTAGQDNPLVSWSAVLWSPITKLDEQEVCRSAGTTLSELQWNTVFSGTPLAHKRKAVCTE